MMLFSHISKICFHCGQDSDGIEPLIDNTTMKKGQKKSGHLSHVHKQLFRT
jgi:hypothetical protein